MNQESITRLEEQNRIKLNDAQRIDVLSFFHKRAGDLVFLNEIDTSQVSPMVRVHKETVALREDVPVQSFTRQKLQAQAPETDAGYWCVPRIMD